MKETYTTFEIGRICSVYPTTVINWIKEGKLPSFATPGGHRRVKRDDLAGFLKKYGLPLPPEFLDEKGVVRILIVDDDLEMVNLIKMVLESEGEHWSIQSVTTGFGAGAKIFEWQPHLILLDFLMPDIDGFEVCRMLRGNPKTKHAKIIAITGLRGEEEKRKVFESGVTDYLPKPFQNRDLVSMVKKHLASVVGLAGAAVSPRGG